MDRNFLIFPNYINIKGKWEKHVFHFLQFNLKFYRLIITSFSTTFTAEKSMSCLYMYIWWMYQCFTQTLALNRDKWDLMHEFSNWHSKLGTSNSVIIEFIIGVSEGLHRMSNDGKIGSFFDKTTIYWTQNECSINGTVFPSYFKFIRTIIYNFILLRKKLGN